MEFILTKNTENFAEIIWNRIGTAYDAIQIYPFQIASYYKNIEDIISKLEYSAIHELIHEASEEIYNEKLIHSMSLLLHSTNDIKCCTSWKDAIENFNKFYSNNYNTINIGKLSIEELKRRKAKRDHNRYQRLHTEQIKALGGVCIECGNRVIEQLEVHHKVPYLSRSRTRAKSYFTTDRNLVEVRCGPRACKNHHADTPNYRRRGKNGKMS